MSLGRWLGVSALVAWVVGCSDARSSDNVGAGGSAGAVGSAGQSSQAGSAGHAGSSAQAGGSAAGGESAGGGGASQAGSGDAPSGGNATAGSAGAASGGDAGEGGDAPTPACDTTGACVAASCGSKECFDLDRCATQEVRYWSTPDHDRSWGMVLNDDDEPVVTGTTQFGGNFNDPSDLFVTQLSKAGAELWSFKLGTAAREYGIGLARDRDGFLYATGASEGDLDGHPNAGSRDVYVLKLSPNGELVWSLLFGSAGSDQGADIQVDTDGNVLVAGSWNYIPNGDSQQPFLARISPAGVLLGNSQLGITHGAAATLEVDAEGNAYVTGESTLPMSGVGDAFVRKVAPDGTVLWAADWGSTEDDWTNGSVLTDIGELYVVGTTSGAIGNNPAPGLGDWSLFVSRLNTRGKVAWTRTYYPGVDTRGGAITLGKNGDLLVAGGVLGKLAPDDQAYGMDFLALRLCQDGAIKGVQRRDLGSDEWTWSLQEATSGDVWYAGYTFRRKTAGAAQDSQDVYLLNIRPE